MRELALSWLVYVPVVLVSVITYWRLPAGATYHFDETGARGAISRTVVGLDYPVAIGGIAMLVLALHLLRGWYRPLAIASVALCLTVAVPGIVSQADLTARYRNLPAALGAVLALTLVAAVVAQSPAVAWARPRSRGDTLRIVIAAVMLVVAIPWMFAAAGFYVNQAPVLDLVFRGSQPTPGEPNLSSVHRGLHEGLAGTQLVLTALLLSRGIGLVPQRALRTAFSVYLALMLGYGVLVAAQDAWNEQLIKRGTVSWDLPSALTPQLDWGWFWVVVIAAVVHVAWFGRERSDPALAAVPPELADGGHDDQEP